MKYPPVRSKRVKYVASWPEHSQKTGIDAHLDSLSVVDDCTTLGGTIVEGSLMVWWSRDEDQSKNPIESYREKLKALNLRVSGGRWVGNAWYSYSIELGEDPPKFRTPLSVVVFINDVAAVFNHPAVAPADFHRIIESREVFVRTREGQSHWMDEAEWLASAATLVP